MKKLLLLGFIFINFSGFSQQITNKLELKPQIGYANAYNTAKGYSPLDFNTTGYHNYECGDWVIDTIVEIVSETDTINYYAEGDTTWIYSNWQGKSNYNTPLPYCPCGCGRGRVEIANRINDRGIIQKIEKYTSYKYIEKPETEYDKKLKKIKSKL